MQRTFVTIVLALALTSAVADYTASNYAKAPVAILADAADGNFTNPNISLSLTLTSVSSGDLYLYGANGTMPVANISQTSWNVWLKKVDGKALTASTNNTYSLTVGRNLFFANNYAVGLTYMQDSSNNISQLYVIQQQLSGGAALPRVAVTTNTNSSFSFGYSYVAVGKNVYVIYEASAGKLNGTSFVIGGAVATSEFQITAAYTSNTLRTTWGEAISSSQVFAMWKEGEVLKDGVIDFSKSTASVSTVGGYNNSAHTCYPYVSDKKDYGEICTQTTGTGKDANITFLTRANTTASLGAYATYNATTSAYGIHYPYGPYLAVIFTDSATTSGSVILSYEIWNLETGANFKNRTQYLTIQIANSSMVSFRVVSGGLYTLLYNQASDVASRTNIQIGLLLGGSYLTSVLGFLLTIIAGLLLF